MRQPKTDATTMPAMEPLLSPLVVVGGPGGVGGGLPGSTPATIWTRKDIGVQE